MDQAAIEQLKLLLQSYQYRDQLQAKLTPILAMLNNYAALSTSERRELIKAIDVLIGNDRKEVFVAALAAYIFSEQVIQPEVMRYWHLELAKALAHPIVKADVNSVVTTINAAKNSSVLHFRRDLFLETNESRLAIAENPDRPESLVVWRARSQADATCRSYNGDVMTPDEFRDRWPVHPNCMCTAELVPSGMGIRHGDVWAGEGPTSIRNRKDVVLKTA